MTRFLPLAVLVLLVPNLFGAPCLPGTLQNYISLGGSGCTLNDVQLFDFYTAPGMSFATPIDPSSIVVTPIGGSSNISLLLTLNASANAGELLESFFHFSASGGALLGAAISLGSPVAAVDGAVIGVLDVCSGGQFNPTEPTGCTGTQGTGIAFATSNDSQLTSPAPVPISSFFDVFVDLTIDGGLAGSASLDSAAVSIQTPEPSTFLLVPASLAALLTLKARRRRRT